MSCKLISPTGSQTCFHLSPKSFQSTTKAMLRPSHLSFNTHLPKSYISIKISSVSYTTRTKATTINSLYAPTQKTESFYELLGIPESGSLPEIKRAYKQLALKYHPDVSPPERKDEYTRTFIRVQEAYQTLSDPKTRALYDRDYMWKGHNVNSRGSGNISDWINLWESQLMELKRRSVMNKKSKGKGINMSWAARIRRQRHKSFC